MLDKYWAKSAIVKIYTVKSVKTKNYKNNEKIVVWKWNDNMEFIKELNIVQVIVLSYSRIQNAIAVCQDSMVFLTRKFPLLITRLLLKSVEWPLNQNLSCLNCVYLPRDWRYLVFLRSKLEDKCKYFLKARLRLFKIITCYAYELGDLRNSNVVNPK